MDSFEINKIVAAILMVALLIIGIGKLSDVIFHVEKPKTPGYAVEVEQAVATNTQTTSETNNEKIDIAALMALGDLAAGEKVLKNVQLVTRLLREERMPLDQHCIMLFLERLVQ